MSQPPTGQGFLIGQFEEGSGFWGHNPRPVRAS